MNTDRRHWIAEYSKSHQHPVNRTLHSVGIPIIALSILLSPAALARPRMRRPVFAMFAGGWALQFIGHAFEKKPPEFLRDPRFLFVGVRWWFEKMRGRA